MHVTALASDLWHVALPPIRMPGGVRLPLASTIVRLPDRSLALYSPGPIDDDAARAIDALGDVAHIIAPSLWHHLYVGHAAARWPRAIVHGAPGLAAKRPDLTLHRELGREPDPAMRDALDFEVIAGAPKFSEAVAFHRASGTLICADFLFNITQPANTMTRMLLAMTGTGGRELRQSRVWRFAIKDLAAARASIDRVIAWPVTRIAPVHGEPHVLADGELVEKVARAYRGSPAPKLRISAATTPAV